LAALGGEEAAFDLAAATLAWGLAVWAVSAWAGWAARRTGRPLLAVLPATALLGTALSFVRQPPAYLIPVLATILLLLPWLHFSRQERLWEAAGVDYSEDIRFDLGLMAILLVTAITLAAAFSPNLTASRLLRWLDELQRPRLVEERPVGKALGLEPRVTPREPPLLEQLRFGGLPREHLLGSGPELSQEVVMTVRTSDPPGSPAARYYWRALVYDQYTGRGWLSGRTEILSYAPGETVAGEEDLAAARWRRVRQQVRAEREPDVPGRPPGASRLGGLLYVAGTLEAVDRGYQAAWRMRPDSGDPASGDLFGASAGAITDYTADSLLLLTDETGLRRAGTDYPAGVRKRYLALPEQVPERVLSLSRDLTATQPTPYDQAKAIEAYLRSFPYSLDVPMPPSGRDVVDYFLFDLKEGYCDYYASAMVVLARAAGLPARLVIGYASGRYEAETSSYIVTEADAHSWPEVYFPGYGWVEFEPTASRPEVRRAEAGSTLGPPPAPEGPLAAVSPSLPDWRPLLRRVAGALALAGLLAAAWALSEGWRLSRMRPASALHHLYAQLRQQGRGLDLPSHPGDTPGEFAASLSGRVARLAARQDWGQAAAQDVRLLAGLYAEAAYSPRPPGPESQRRAIQLWGRLRWRLLAARLRSWMKIL
jgi:transglutaminase-like putative cysteine protease